MSFDQWITVAALIAGPLGIALGWGLSELGESRRAATDTARRTQEARQSRALAVLASASTIEGEGRNLSHAAYVSGTTGRTFDKGQVIAAQGMFNGAMADLDRLILEADVLGPPGLSDVGRMLQLHGRDLVSIVTAMQASLTATDVAKVQDETLPAFVAAIEQATTDVRSILASTA